MNVPVFIDISLEDQAEELRVYFKSLGAEISAERSEKGIEDDLHKGTFTCDVRSGWGERGIPQKQTVVLLSNDLSSFH